MREHIRALADVLRDHGELEPAADLEAVLVGSNDAVMAFLVSNTLWGGSGSFADQAGIGQTRDVRRSIEVVLIALGEQQIREGVTNVRTAGWVDVFRQWQRDGV